MRIVVDYSVCESNGICMGLMPDVFELDDGDNLNVLQDDVTPENEDDVLEAVRQCPRQAIVVVE
jgi:ferredoxin